MLFHGGTGPTRSGQRGGLPNLSGFGAAAIAKHSAAAQKAAAQPTLMGPTLVGVLGDPSFVLGPATQAGATYNCSANTCYAISSAGADVNTAFVNFQKALNAVGGSAGFTQIAADGLIGPGTAAAYNKAVAWMASVGGTTPTTFTVQQIAPNVLAYTQALQYFAGAHGATAAKAPPANTPPSSPPIILPGDQGANQQAAKKTMWPYYAAAAVGGFAILAIAFKLSSAPPRSAPPRAALPAPAPAAPAATPSPVAAIAGLFGRPYRRR